MRKRNVIAISVFVVFYVVFGALLTLNQERFIYRPFPQEFSDCPALTAADTVTHQGTRMYVHDTDKPVAVLYHGNAGAACDRAFYADLFARAGYGYVLVEYAGYSNDTRTPTHERIKQDAEHVIAYLEEAGVTDVAIIGESIGSGAAAYHTALNPPQKLLLITPFTDLAALARRHVWFYPTSLLIDNAFDNVANLSQYQGLVTIMHGTDDSIVPFALGQELFQSLPTRNKELIAIDNGDHNDLFIQENTATHIVDFLTNP